MNKEQITNNLEHYLFCHRERSAAIQLIECVHSTRYIYKFNLLFIFSLYLKNNIEYNHAVNIKRKDYANKNNKKINHKSNNR